MAKSRKNYGKRPLWQWLMLYILIGGVIYFFLYSSGYLPKISLLENSDSQYNEVSVFE